MTTNGSKGAEDARRIAPGVTRSEFRTGLAIVLIGLAFLLCPGCAETRAAAPLPTAEGVVVHVEGANGWDALRSLIFAAVIVVGIKAMRRYYGERLRRGADATPGVLAEAREELEEAQDLAESRWSMFELTNAELGQARQRIRDLEAERAAVIRERNAIQARVEVLELHERDRENARQRIDAALDACARLLDGQPGDREWTAAREALRATGRLGGVTITGPTS